MVEIDRRILKNIGLTDNEIQVYLTLLKLGSSPVSKIAEHSELYRPYVYDNLKRLTEKGLVSFVIEKHKQCYKALQPEKLLEIEEIKIKELQTLIPKLQEFVKIPKEETKVELFKGKEVVRVIQKDVLNTLIKIKGENLVIGVNEKKFMETDEVIMRQFFAQMKEYKLKERVLVREGDNYLPGHKDTTSYKFLSKEFFDSTSTFIYGNKVAIILFGEPMHALLIESKILSGAYRKQFELLWKIASKENW